jgi:hypothetical protein
MPADDCAARFRRIRDAFEADGLGMIALDDPAMPGGEVPYLERQGFIACAAEHKAPRSQASREPKIVYYVEGSNYLMGYFMGIMAEKRVKMMAVDYCDNVVFDFFSMESMVRNNSRLAKKLKALIVEIIYKHSQSMIRDIPYEYIDELKGMLDGCYAINPSTEVTWDRLWGLNYGIDCLIAHVYTGDLFKEAGIAPHRIRMPIFCNAFGMSQPAAASSTFLGRDFMFPTATVFQDAACLIIHKPGPLEGVPRNAFVSQTAPGIIGSVVAMNEKGTGIGIEMLPSAYCRSERPGFNALGLNRDVAQYCADADGGAERVRNTQRGVSWLYSIADSGGRSCLLETGLKPDSGESFPYHEYVSKYYRKKLPKVDELETLRREHRTPEPDRGTLVRWSDYSYASELVEKYNPVLFAAYNRKLLDRIGDKIRGIAGCFIGLFTGGCDSIGDFFSELWEVLTRHASWSDCDSSERGFYCKDQDDRILPGPYYFAPQREPRADLVIGTNHFVSPEMRLLSMTDWLELIEGAELSDSQWRYDALNSYVLDSIDAAAPRGGVDFELAWKLVDFLDPLRGERYRDYYNPGGKLDPANVIVHGSVNLLDLKNLRIRSLWGYYGDEAVTIDLKRYL